MFYPLWGEKVFSLSFIVWFMVISFRRIKENVLKVLPLVFIQILSSKSPSTGGHIAVCIAVNQIKLVSTLLPLKFGIKVFLMLDILTDPFFLLLSKGAKSNEKGDPSRNTQKAI